jgi:hypothetical protein
MHKPTLDGKDHSQDEQKDNIALKRRTMKVENHRSDSPNWSGW